MFESLQNSFSGITTGTFISTSISDYAIFISCLFWFLGLMIPTKSIDKSDTLTLGMYILYYATSGIIMIIALPEQQAMLIQKTNSPALVILACISVTIARWLIAKKYQPLTIYTQRYANVKKGK